MTINTKSFSIVAVKNAGDPSAKQLEAINRYTLREFAAEEIYVRTAYLAHNAIDRDKEVFDEALLKDFERTLPGKGFFIKHPRGWDGDSGPGKGRWFEARLLEMSLDEARTAMREPQLQFPPGTDKAVLLEASYYIVRSDTNKDLILDIDAGVASDVSIGFKASQRSDILDGNNNYIASRLHGPGEAVEGSMVWLGAQPGARTVKHFGNNDGAEEDDMPVTDQEHKTLQDKHDNLQNEVTTLQPKAAAFDAAKTAVGELADKPDELKATVAAGKKYVEELINDVIAAKRHEGVLGDDEQAVNDAKAFYKTMPLTMLEGEAKAARAKTQKGGQLEGGDPNATGASQPVTGGKGGAVDYSNPMQNPALKSA